LKNIFIGLKSKKITCLFCVLLLVLIAVFVMAFFINSRGFKSGYEIITDFDSERYASGSVYFYAQKTKENDIPQIKNYAKMEDVPEFLNLLKQQKWVDDALVDRTEFEFDGKVFHNGWIYFGYDSVIFYNGYFCNTTEEIDAILKECYENSKPYYNGELGEGKLTFEYNSSLEPFNPSVIIFPQENKYQFIYSGFSSYVPDGEYELTEERLVLKSVDGDFVFDVVPSGFKFNAEKSVKIPEYKYSGDSAEKKSPVPDGAVFKLRKS